MYQIRYKDPMTGSILETQAHSLTDAVTAIQKAKDDLYYRGHSLQKSEDLSAQKPEDKNLDSEQKPSLNEDESVKDDDHTEDNQDLDEFLYPYGVTLW